MKIKCLIVDDEPLAVRLIEQHLSKMDRFEVVATCNNALKAFEILNRQPVDLMFLDIKMPNLSGIEFLKNLKNPPKTILTTAYRDFAIESYDIGVVDYLLKPIIFERFFKAVDKFLQANETISKKAVATTTNDFVLFKSGLKSYKINSKEILYIESLKDYIKIHLTTGRAITFKYKISDIELELREKNFLQVHRSFLVNTGKISAFTNNEIEIGDIVIPIGAHYKDGVLLFLDVFKL